MEMVIILSMNEIISKLLLFTEKFMPETHSRQLIFMYSACGLFTKNKESVQKVKESGG